MICGWATSPSGCRQLEGNSIQRSSWLGFVGLSVCPVLSLLRPCCLVLQCYACPRSFLWVLEMLSSTGFECSHSSGCGRRFWCGLARVVLPVVVRRVVSGLGSKHTIRHIQRIHCIREFLVTVPCHRHVHAPLMTTLHVLHSPSARSAARARVSCGAADACSLSCCAAVGACGGGGACVLACWWHAVARCT